MPMYNYSRFKPVGDLELSAGYGQTYREYFAEMACLCLKKYNKENSKKNVRIFFGLANCHSPPNSYMQLNLICF